MDLDCDRWRVDRSRGGRVKLAPACLPGERGRRLFHGTDRSAAALPRGGELRKPALERRIGEEPAVLLLGLSSRGAARKRRQDGPRERDGLNVTPLREVARRIDRAVLAERAERHRMDLEVHVVRASVRVAGVPDEAEHLPRSHMRRVQGEWGEAREMGVVEGVARGVREPQAPAADLLPADVADRAVGDRDDGRAERGEQVVAVVPLARDVES